MWSLVYGTWAGIIYHLTRVDKSYLLALGTTQISPYLPERELLTQVRFRAGPVKALLERLIGYAPLNNTYFDVIFWHGVPYVPTNLWGAIPFFFFFSEGFMTDPKIRKKEKVTKTSVIKQKRKRDCSVGKLVTSGEKDVLYYWDLGPERQVGKVEWAR